MSRTSIRPRAFRAGAFLSVVPLACWSLGLFACGEPPVPPSFSPNLPNADPDNESSAIADSPDAAPRDNTGGSANDRATSSMNSNSALNVADAGAAATANANTNGTVEANSNESASLSRCIPDESLRSPSSVVELVQLLNALPRPTGLACFLESLARPLEVYVSRSPLSAQPAVSADSPRVFLFIEDFVMSVVLGGPASETLEFGLRLADERSVRGELGFPLRTAITPASMRAQIAIGAVSLCANCHGNEVPARSGFYEGAIESNIVVPNDFYLVELAQLNDSWQRCDPSEDANRCQLLNALFSNGELIEVPFR